MKTHPIRRWLVILLALGLSATACSVDDPDNAPAEAETPNSAGDADGETGEPVAAAPTRTTLEVVIPTDPVGLNPFPETAGNMAVVHLALSEALIGVDSDQNIHSNVLESWDVSEDAKTITLKVAPGLEWSDGTPITSADVVMSLGLHLDPAISTRAARLQGGIKGWQAYVDGEADTIAGLTAADDHTVVIELDNSDAAWLPNLASLTRLNSMWPAHILGDVPRDEIPDHPYFETFPVVSGPYKFVKYVPAQHVELERNENWSLGEAGFEKLFFKIITESEATVAQLQAGEIQYMDGVSPLDVERLEAIDGITVGSATGLNPNIIGFAYDHPLLQDARVRQAMLFAIDREGICEQALQGYCTVSSRNLRLVGLDWAAPTVAEGATEYTYDPDRAKALLDEAGWDSSNTLSLLARPDGAGTAMTAAIEIMQAQWADVGINVEIVNVDVPTLLDNLGREGRDPDSHMFWNAGAVFTLDPSSVQPYNSCGTHYPNGPNLTYYCLPDLEPRWQEARQVADESARGEIYKELFLAENQDPHNVYIAVVDNIVAFDSRLKGVKPMGDIWQTYWNIGEWHWEE